MARARVFPREFHAARIFSPQCLLSEAFVLAALERQAGCPRSRLGATLFCLISLINACVEAEFIKFPPQQSGG